jgi:DNA-binding transcriptional ArsR family regulator
MFDHFGKCSRPVSCEAALVPLTYNYMVVCMTLSDADVDRIFQALSDRTRRDILERAIEREQSVSAMARQYDMSFAAVQKHVAVLERAALVTKERRGREQIVHANGPTFAKAIALLDQYEQLWIDRANQIAEILAESDEAEGDHS